jgi:hypothetical protein
VAVVRSAHLDHAPWQLGPDKREVTTDVGIVGDPPRAGVLPKCVGAVHAGANHYRGATEVEMTNVYVGSIPAISEVVVAPLFPRASQSCRTGAMIGAIGAPEKSNSGD